MTTKSRRAMHLVLYAFDISVSGFTAAELDDALANGIAKPGKHRFTGSPLPELRRHELRRQTLLAYQRRTFGLDEDDPHG